MTIATATASWRDLVRVRVPLAKLWRHFATNGTTTLYTLRQVVMASRAGVDSHGYTVTLHETPLLKTFEGLVQEDPAYRPRWRDDERHVLFDGDPMPPRRLQQKI